MHEKGYRDATILKDSIYQYNRKSIGINLSVYEGPKYYFGNITWVGNAKYNTAFLEKVFGSRKIVSFPLASFLYNTDWFCKPLFL